MSEAKVQNILLTLTFSVWGLGFIMLGLSFMGVLPCR